MKLRLAELFTSGMTLQREKPVEIWGWSDEAGEVDIYINQKLTVQKGIGRGKFQIQIPPQPAMENAELKIGNIVLTKVDFGEVWIAGGQSNMEFMLRYDKDAKATVQEADDDHLRYYCVGKYTYEGQKEDKLEDDTYFDKWFCLKQDVAEQFSAVGLYFAQELRVKYKVPVAVIGCNYGGSTASAWMEAEYLTGPSEVYLKDYEEQTENLDLETYYEAHEKWRQMSLAVQGEMMDAIMFGGDAARDYFAKAMEQSREQGQDVQNSAEAVEYLNPMGPRNQNRPGGLYEVMLKKIIGFAVRGVIWYQGESDDVHPNVYSDLFTKMIACWRDGWKEKLPFIFVQLAPFEQWMGNEGGKVFAALREQQQLVADQAEDVWMVSSSDAGDRFDIHPKEKRPIGHRLAVTAMNRVYHDDVGYEYPRGEGVQVKENKITVIFNGGKTLEVRGDKVEALEVMSDGVSIDVVGYETEGSKLILYTERDCSNSVVTVKFAYQPYYQVNLYNENGIPGVPFIISNQCRM